MNRDPRESIDEMRDLHLKLQEALFFYRKYLNSDTPKYRGIPFVRASEGFSLSRKSTYGDLVSIFLDAVDSLGVGHLRAKVLGPGGWSAGVQRAMDILFPPSSDAEKDPGRAAAALPILERVVDTIGRDIDGLEMSLSSDPGLFNLSEDDIIEEVIRRLRRQ